MTIALDVHASTVLRGDYSCNTYNHGITTHVTTTVNDEIIVAVLSSVSVNGQSSHSQAEYNGYVPFANVGDGGTGLVWQRRSQTQYKIELQHIRQYRSLVGASAARRTH